MSRRRYASAVIAILLGAVLPSMPSSVFAGDYLPVDTRDSLSLSFGALSVEEVPAEYQYLSLSIPGLLRETLSRVERRIQDADEREAYAAALRASALEDVERRIRSAVASRDAVLFDRSAQASARRDRFSAELEELRELRAALLQSRTEEIAVQSELPVRHVDADASLRGFPAPGETPDSDLLVSGTLAYEDEYLLITLGLYRTLTEDVRTIGPVLVRPEDVNDEIESLSDRLARLLLGRDFASLIVDPGRSGAAVYVDGRLEGFGRLVIPYAQTGTRAIRISAAGFRGFRSDVDLSSGERRELSVDLAPHPRTSVQVVTEPAGAQLFVGAEFVGTTPVSLDRPVGPRTAELRHEGYLSRRFVLDTEGDSNLAFTLTAAERDPRQELIDSREGFYRSLGLFAVSVPVPLMLGGIFQSEVSYIAGNPAVPQSAAEDRGAYLASIQTAQALGVAVSASLLVHSLWRLSRYIQAGRYYHSD
ncbi:MAG: PEGA domain-containing protein [Spirochaetaceae bacterium]|nr:MAG: PEGA domain-containing protein [Spirochaetaceae bacterium]